MMLHCGKAEDTDSLRDMYNRAYYLAETYSDDTIPHYRNNDVHIFTFTMKGLLKIVVAINDSDFVKEDNVSLSTNVFLDLYSTDFIYERLKKGEKIETGPCPYGIVYKWLGNKRDSIADRNIVYVTHQMINMQPLGFPHSGQEYFPPDYETDPFPYETSRDELEQVSDLLTDFGYFLSWGYKKYSSDPNYIYIFVDTSHFDRKPIILSLNGALKTDFIKQKLHELWLRQAEIRIR